MGIKDGLALYVALIQQVMTKPQRFRIEDNTNPVFADNGIRDYLDIDPADVQGEYDIVIVSASRSLENPEIAAKVQAWIVAGMQDPEIAPYLKRMDAWLWMGEELLKVPTPRRFIRSKEEMAQAAAQQLQQLQPPAPMMAPGGPVNG